MEETVSTIMETTAETLAETNPELLEQILEKISSIDIVLQYILALLTLIVVYGMVKWFMSYIGMFFR